MNVGVPMMITEKEKKKKKRRKKKKQGREKGESRTPTIGFRRPREVKFFDLSGNGI